MKSPNNVGMIKVLFDRSRTYMTSLNTLMLGYLFIEKSGGWQWYYVFALVFLVVFAFLDHRFIISQERDYNMSRPGLMNDMRLEIKEIYKILKRGSS